MKPTPDPSAVRLTDPWGEMLKTASLFAAWDQRQGLFPWPDGPQRELRLPFGRAELRLEQLGADALSVTLDVFIEQRIGLFEIELRYEALKQPDYVWVPHLRPGPDLVIADQVFRTPVLALLRQGRGIALLPDCADCWPRDLNTYLDLRRAADPAAPQLSHGLAECRTSGHVFFKRSSRPVELQPGRVLRLSHILLTLDGPDALGRAAAFAWERWARRDDVRPQVLALERYERLVVERIFAPDMYHEFDWQERRVAGMQTQSVTARRKPALMNERGVRSFLRNQRRLARLLGLIQRRVFTDPLGNRLLTAALHSGRFKVTPVTSYIAWNNQVRTALAAALHARRNADAALLERCGRMVEPILSAPDEQGLFPGACLFPADGPTRWVRGYRGFELVDWFHLPDAALTGYHLLQWRELIQDDPRIVERCRGLAERLLELQDPSGAFPCWVRPGPSGMEIDPTLERSAASAGPALLLALLGRVEQDDRLLAAARRALEFVETAVLPEDKWFDFELLYSCAGRPTGGDGPDPYTGCWPMNTLCMYWAAAACLELHQADGAERWLELGRRVLSRLNLFQQAFDNPRVSIDSFGGFGVMNADAEHNDARQGLFAPLYLDYYLATGEPELFERGVAALRASFTTMLVEEHRQIAPGNMVNFRPADRGAILENYGHNGRDEVSSGYLAPDWGCGTALYAATLIRERFGQAYVDLPRWRAFGIDLCSARFDALDGSCLRVSITPDPPTDFVLVVDGPEGAVEALLVNGKAARPLGSGRWIL